MFFQLAINAVLIGCTPFAGDQAQRCVTRRGDQVVTPLGHQAYHFVRGGGGFHVDLAAGFLLETGDPVVGLVAFAAFDIAGPGDDIQLAFTCANGLERFGGLNADAGQQRGGQGAE